MENYQQDSPPAHFSNKLSGHKDTSITTGEWILTFLLLSIPVVGFVLLFVWAFSAETHPCKANWAKASLVWMLIIAGLYLIFFLVVLAIAGAGIGELLRY